MDKEIEKLPVPWRFQTKTKICSEMHDMWDDIEAVRRKRFKSVLVFIKSIISKRTDRMSDIEKCVINSLMTCDAEDACTKWSELLKNIEEISHLYTDSPQQTFKALEKEKCLERYINLKCEKANATVTKVIYYLRKCYVNNTAPSDSLPDFILDLMCGFELEDQEYYLIHCNKVHARGKYCAKFGGQRLCPFEHYDFITLNYTKKEPDELVILNCLLKNI